MTTLTIELPESLKQRIEALAAQEGYTVSQFVASAESEKLAVMRPWITCVGKRPLAGARISRST
jgi:predicted transcriptional regulator